MRTRAFALVVLALGLLGGCGDGDGEPAPSEAELQRIADGLTQEVFTGKLLAGVQAFHIPGAALSANAAPGKTRTVVSGASNVADDRRLGVDQVQPVGSATKTITATIAMQLVEDDRVGLDDTIPEIATANDGDGGALRRLARGHPDRLRDVTLRQCLNHTTGLADFFDSKVFGAAFERDPERSWTLAELAGLGLDEQPLFRPGAKGEWNYSNTDYVLAGMVIEAVSGNAVAEEMERIFVEAGMESSHYAPTPSDVRSPPLAGELIDGYMPLEPAGAKLPAIVRAFDGLGVVDSEISDPRAVEAVSTNPSESGPTVEVSTVGGTKKAQQLDREFRFQNVTNAYNFGVGVSAGGVVSNTGDLASFWRALFEGELVSEETLGEMQRTVPTGENSKGVEVRWGLGFGNQRIEPGILFKGSPELSVWYHQGNIFGYSSASYYVDQEDLVVTNAVNIFPQPVGDLGVLRDVLRAAPLNTRPNDEGPATATRTTRPRF